MRDLHRVVHLHREIELLRAARCSVAGDSPTEIVADDERLRVRPGRPTVSLTR